MKTGKEVTRVGVIADTHIPSRAGEIPSGVIELFHGVDAILHAGDFVDRTVFDELARIAPTFGVLGNMDPPDLAALLPMKRVVELGGISIGMIHDSGRSARRRERMNGQFPDCRAVVFGHSHQAVIEDDGRLLLLNPGSASNPRFSEKPSVLMLEIRSGSPSAEFVEL